MTLLASRYHLLRKLASGGMAEVWLSEQRGPGSFVRRMVVKTIHPHLADDADLVTAFADEARLAGLLRHPHIVRVEDFGEHDGRPFLVMEYLEGHTLRQLAALANGLDERMPERLILQLGIQVAGALNYAHGLCAENGEPLHVVHRDVSPQNIMISPEGAAKLLDFGIARATSNLGKTRTGTLKGKLAYLSPEQATGKSAAVDHRADQFGLGVVLWELLVGSRLLASDSDIGTLQRVAFGDIPSLALYGGEYSKALIATIDRTLKRRRSERFANCAAFAGALRECLSEAGGAFSNIDYHAWLSHLAIDQSVPKALPMINVEAVQRTESVPALSSLPEELTGGTAEPMPTPFLEEATQITATAPDLNAEAPTRVSLKVVSTATDTPALQTPVEAPISLRAAPGQLRLLLTLIFAAVAGIVAVFVWDSGDSEGRAATLSAAQTAEAFQQQSPDQLSKDQVLAVIAANRTGVDSCFAHHGFAGAAPLIELGIRSNGKATSVRVTTPSEQLASCLSHAIQKLRFPTFRGRAASYRFRLKP